MLAVADRARPSSRVAWRSRAYRTRRRSVSESGRILASVRVRRCTCDQQVDAIEQRTAQSAGMAGRDRLRCSGSAGTGVAAGTRLSRTTSTKPSGEIAVPLAAARWPATSSSGWPQRLETQGRNRTASRETARPVCGRGVLPRARVQSDPHSPRPRSGGAERGNGRSATRPAPWCTPATLWIRVTSSAPCATAVQDTRAGAVRESYCRTPAVRTGAGCDRRLPRS